MNSSVDEVIAATRGWIERAVIGLNLCPFAKAVYVRERIRYTVSEARSVEALLEDLVRELQYLAEVPPEKIDTTLLIHPYVLQDFLDFNDFLDTAEAAVEALGLTGVLQVASFHPQYRFADSEPEDIANYTNRSPYPTLHLLREASIEQAVESYGDAERIYRQNIRTMRELGLEGWLKLRIGEP